VFDVYKKWILFVYQNTCVCCFYVYRQVAKNSIPVAFARLFGHQLFRQQIRPFGQEDRKGMEEHHEADTFHG
jgi:hypothetical protein